MAGALIFKGFFSLLGLLVSHTPNILATSHSPHLFWPIDIMDKCNILQNVQTVKVSLDYDRG